MQIPFPTPDENAVKAMNKAWSRHRLDKYLQRWDGSIIPEAPADFLVYKKRAVDVGCGFGKHLINQCQHQTDWGFLGIDKGSLRGGSMIKRFQQQNCPNLFGLHGNAIPIMAGMPDNSLDLITIFYPNPWWPAKHRKKRWSYHPLLPKLVSLLRSGGQILLTSNEDFYLGEWEYALKHHPEAKDVMEHVYSGPINVEEGRSHFETNFLEEGTPCGEVVFQKK